MINFLFSDILKATKVTHFQIIEDVPIQKIFIDSREIFFSRYALFIALQGTRDGHQFLLDAYQKGIRHFILSDLPPHLPADVSYVQVPNTLKALQAISLAYRKRFQIPIIALTGSNGKTIVKEWLSIFFSSRWKVARSPQSYNSQIGVPLSLLVLRPEHEIGIIEAGISRPNEMQVLEQLILPTEGILTHLGDAHQEHFTSFEQKIQEKLKLFVHCSKVYASIHQATALQILQQTYPDSITISQHLPTTYRYEFVFPFLVLHTPDHQTYRFKVPFYDHASLENLALCLMVAMEKGFKAEALQPLIFSLPTLPMRLELITDNQEFTFIMDTWSSDFDSLQQALYLLHQTSTFPQKKLILTEFENLKLESELFQYILKTFSPENLYLIGKAFLPLRQHYKVYEQTDTFLNALKWEELVNSVILLKGSRSYQLEKVYHALNLKASTTYLKINLKQLKKNFGVYRSLLKPETKMMLMLKADSYGSGSWEIAKNLEAQLDYIGVAYTVEGVHLRRKGIIAPIMVMAPDLNSLHWLEKYQLEPAVGAIELLQALLPFRLKVHIEIETGMNRLGFRYEDLNKVISLLQNSQLKVISVFTHLASADCQADDPFTLQQIQAFEQAVEKFHQAGLYPLRHCLNTAGIERFSNYQMDMVRLGIGLYGISQTLPEVQEIGKMYSKITRIHRVQKGEAIGYNRSFIADREMVIATVPVGYADGLKRSLSNGRWHFKLNETLCPIVGKICMDMTMIDITAVPNAKAGDEVLIFGEPPLSIQEMALQAGTIPYECLVSIPGRVKRIFAEE